MLELNAKIRETLGKKVKSLRKQGVIPAVLYGAKIKLMPLGIDYNEFEKVYEQAGESTVVKLKIKNKEKKEEMRNVLIYDVDQEPVTDKFIHIDFYQVRMDKPITVEVPLVFEGESLAVETEDGVLIKNITEVEVEALPANLPHEIKVDISTLKTFEDSIHIKDLKVSEGAKILAEFEEVVVSVIPPRSEEELAALEEEVAAEGEPRLEREEKVEEVEKAGEPVESPEGIQAGPPASTQRGEPQSEGLGGEEKEEKGEKEGK